MIATERLVLRQWRDGDRDAFADMSADADVMRHLDGCMDRAASDAVIDRHSSAIEKNGHGFWAVERRDDGALLGFCGVRIGGHAGTPVPEELEIGWRLRRDVWGRGYAKEAAMASLGWGWDNRPNARIAAWTVPANTASWGLMLALGMRHQSELDFDHPGFAPGHPLSRHIVYTIDRPQ